MVARRTSSPVLAAVLGSCSSQGAPLSLPELEGEVVLDASLFLAVISLNEIHHESARKLYDGMPADRPFIVPVLFRIEVLSALSPRWIRPSEAARASGAAMLEELGRGSVEPYP